MFAPDIGWIEVIYSGAMFANKTKELLHRLDAARWANKSYAVFKPCRDNRYATDAVVTHSGEKIPSYSVSHPFDIVEKAKDYDIIAIDEANFFQGPIVEAVKIIRDTGKRVIIAGLAITSEGKPFGHMPQLMAIADHITPVFSICTCCGRPATKTQTLVPKEGDVLVGGKESYEPRCNRCWTP